MFWGDITTVERSDKIPHALIAQVPIRVCA